MTNHFTVTEFQQFYYFSQKQSLVPLFDNSIVRKGAYEIFGEDNTGPIVREVCRSSSIFREPNIKHILSFFALFGYHNTDV